jgi:hypothetical protein
VIYNFKSRWNEAAGHYFEAIEYYDSLGSNYHITIAYANVGGVLMDARTNWKSPSLARIGFATIVLPTSMEVAK